MTASKPFLERIGLGRRELRAWAMFDWGNSAYQSTVVNAVFPLFFANYAAAGLAPTDATARFAWATTIAVIIVALLGPPLGAVADYGGRKKLLLGLFLALAIAAVGLMPLIQRGGWIFAAVLFIVATIGERGSWIFYDSLLPHIASRDEVDRVSMAGFAIGYIGGGILLLINLGWILSPQTFGFADTLAATKASLFSVAIWWLVFSIPLFRRVPEPPATKSAGREPASALAPFVRAWHTFHELRQYRNAFLMLCAFLLYNDGIQTMIRMSTIYAAEVGIDTNAQIAALVMVQFIGIPCAFLFGAAADRVGAKPALFVAIAVYTLVSIVAYFMTSAWQFFLLAFLVGLVQGAGQGLSRSLFARMIPKDKSSEYFGFFSVFEKFAGVAGPALFALSITLFGSSRAALLSVILFFIAGAAVLTRVDVKAGEAQVQATT